MTDTDLADRYWVVTAARGIDGPLTIAELTAHLHEVPLRDRDYVTTGGDQATHATVSVDGRCIAVRTGCRLVAHSELGTVDHTYDTETEAVAMWLAFALK